MSNTAAPSEKRSLTPNDPVDTETLEQFRRLQEAQQRFADNLLALEREKIQILAAAKKIDDQRSRLFEACCLERGIPPQTMIEVDGRTGKISILEGAPEPVRVSIPS